MSENGMSGVEKVGFGFVEKDNEVFVSVKEEPLAFVDENDRNNLDGGEWAEEEMPRAMVGISDHGLPPFLRKTFEMVDDGETNSIISWSFSKESFIIWDPHKFCTDLLPNYFKHNNFSSFVRQLNTYRFRKINPDRWEFANEGFQQGKKHLLKHIKRRNHPKQSCQDLHKLRDDHNSFRNQIMELKHQHHTSLHHLTSLTDRLRTAQTKQNQMLAFMIKSLKNPVSLHRCIQRMKEKKGLGGRFFKKRRLASDAMNEEELMIESENQSLSCDEWGTSNSLEVLSESFVLWEKLMEDDMIYEEDEQHSVLVSELEKLITKPVNGMVELVGCSAST